MKKTNLKKILAMILCIIMVVSALTLFVSADTETVPIFAKTVYMSSKGNNENDGLTEETSVSTLEEATKKLGENGGEIVIVDDMIIDPTSIEVTASGHRIYLADSYSTVYIHGKKKADNTYPTLLFDTTSTGKAPIIEMAGPLAVYDLGLGSVNKCNLWISTCGYPITIGENVTRVQENGGSINICGGQQDPANSGMMSTQTTSVVTVYSGKWGTICGGAWAKGTAQTDATINIIGGEFSSIYGFREGAAMTGNVTINFYGGIVGTRLISYEKENITNTLNVYNDCMDAATKATVQGVFAENGSGTINNLTGAVPDFFTISKCIITPPAPPSFGDDPNQGGNDNTDTDLPANTDDNDDTNDAADTGNTKSPDMSEAPQSEAPAENGGCGSVIGASAFIVVVIMGTVIAVGKKRES